MTLKYNKVKTLISGLLLGSALTITAYTILVPSQGEIQPVESSARKPLYWVAPMDPDFRRDKPGISPMGMDLIPVYETDNSAGGPDTGPGTIRISPEVINNLGVRIAVAERKPLPSVINTVGYVQYDEEQVVHLQTRVDGWIQKLFVKAEGEPVNKDQRIYEFYAPAFVNAQEELVIALGRGNRRLVKAAEDRLKALHFPPREIEALKKSKKVKQTITIFAPQTGVVDNLNIREGFFIKPGDPIMSIGTLDQVWVAVEIFERQAFQVTRGLPVTMSLDYLPGKEWQGHVDYVYPTLDAKTRTVKVRLRFNNEDQSLKPNMFAQIIIQANSPEDSLLVPREAVIRTGAFDRVVLALGEGRFKSVQVKVGRFEGQFAEILSGLDAGDRVVASAQFLLDSESSKTSDFKRMTPPGDLK